MKTKGLVIRSELINKPAGLLIDLKMFTNYRLKQLGGKNGLGKFEEKNPITRFAVCNYQPTKAPENTYG